MVKAIIGWIVCGAAWAAFGFMVGAEIALAL